MYQGVYDENGAERQSKFVYEWSDSNVTGAFSSLVTNGTQHSSAQ
jgi:hypothetical protein